MSTKPVYQYHCRTWRGWDYYYYIVGHQIYVLLTDSKFATAKLLDENLNYVYDPMLKTALYAQARTENYKRFLKVYKLCSRKGVDV